MLEVILHMPRTILQSTHEGAGLLLEVAVEIFVRIEFRGIQRQIKDLDLLFVFFQPGLDDLAVMDPQVIENQKNLAVRVLDQAGHEFDQHFGVHALSIQHKPHFTAIRDRRDHVNPTLGGIDSQGAQKPWSST